MPSISRFERRSLPGRRRRIALRVAAVLVLALIVARLLLPFAAVRTANARLAGLEGYAGRVGAADFRVARGGFALEDVVFRRSEAEAGDGALRIEVERVDVSFSWIQLARGRLSAEIEFVRPRVFYSAGPSGAETAGPPEESGDPREVLAGLRRFEITRLEIVDGAATMEWPVGERTQTLALAGLHARFANLGNDPARHVEPVAAAKIAARFPGGGVIMAHASGAPLASPPFVHARMEIDELNLTLLNPILIEALGTDVSAGSLRVEAEFRAAEGYYEGFVSPFVSDAQFTRPGSDNVSFGEGVRAVMLDAAETVLRNNDTKRVASRVPFSGRFGNGDVDGWTAFVTLLGNAFGEALRLGRVIGEPE